MSSKATKIMELAYSDEFTRQKYYFDEGANAAAEARGIGLPYGLVWNEKRMCYLTPDSGDPRTKDYNKWTPWEPSAKPRTNFPLTKNVVEKKVQIITMFYVKVKKNVNLRRS